MNVRRSLMLAGFCAATLVVAHIAWGRSTPPRPGQILSPKPGQILLVPNGPRPGQILWGSTELDNPGGVETGPGDYTVYVASAGTGAGATGYITKFVDRGAKRPRTAQRIASGFVSGRTAGGPAAVGLRDVAVTPGGFVYAIVSAAGRRPGPGPASGTQMGTLLQILAGGEKHPVADVAGFEYSRNPRGGGRVSDPSSVETSPAGLAVTDEARGDLLLVSWDGGVRVLATFPPSMTGSAAPRSMPSSVTLGPDEAYYVGELAGGVRGAARIWRVVPGEAPTVWKTGFTAISGLDFGPDGSLYVTELAKNGLAAAQKGDGRGALIRITPKGLGYELVAGKLQGAVGGVAAGPDGIVYVTENATSGHKGRLVAIRP